MRGLSAAVLFLCLVPACSGGASPPTGTSTTSSPTSPGDEPGRADRQPTAGGADGARSGGVCAEYIACIAKKAPEMLAVVTDAYGKSGSCWAEMSAEACEDACAAGKTKTKCDVCDPALGSCLGEACAPNKRCASGEVCAKGKCIEDAFKLCGASDNGSDCPAPYECTGAGDGYACLLTCAADDDCPARFTCSKSYGFCTL